MTDCELFLQIYHVNGALQLERDAETFGTFLSTVDATTDAIADCDRYYGDPNGYVLRTFPQRNPDGTIALLAIATPRETDPDERRQA